MRTINEMSVSVGKCDDDAINGAILFATKTCPNCKMAGVFLEKAGIAYDKVYAEESADLVERFGIKQAPTLVVVENGKEIARAVNLSNIRKYIESV